MCRLVSATQLAGERGQPVVDLSVVAPWLASGDVTVLLGPASELGAALARRRDDLARAALEPWRELVPRANLLVELVSHRLPRPATSPAPVGVRAPLLTPPGWPGSPAPSVWVRC